MNTTHGSQKSESGYRVCGGRLFLNDEPLPVHGEVVRIGAAAAGLEACGALSEADVERIFQMERALSTADLSNALNHRLSA